MTKINAKLLTVSAPTFLPDPELLGYKNKHGKPKCYFPGMLRTMKNSQEGDTSLENTMTVYLLFVL